MECGLVVVVVVVVDGIVNAVSAVCHGDSVILRNAIAIIFIFKVLLLCNNHHHLFTKLKLKISLK